MKQFLKVVIWIVILGAVCFGIYTVLPEYPHDFIKSFVQPIVDGQAKIRIDQIKRLKADGLDDVTYEQALEKSTGMSCWVYEKEVDKDTGLVTSEKVVFRGNGASINMKDYTDYNGKLYTSCAVKFEFIIDGNNVDIIPYIDGVQMNIKDGAHVEKNKEVRKNILQQMYNGVTSE